MSRLRFVMVSVLLLALTGTAAWMAIMQAPLHAMGQQAAVAGAQADDRRTLVKGAYAEYPAEALDKQISGIVVANITINSAGEVTTASVVSGAEVLRTSAFKAAMALKYSPGAGTAVMTIGVAYMLDKQSWGVRILSPLTAPGGSPAMAGGTQRGPGGGYRVGGEIRAPVKIKDAPPVYPREAQNAGVQGVVILETTISETGSMADVKVLRSIPLLDQAAIDAVKQWQYEPTLLNGVAIPVIMTVTVNFAMRQGEISMRLLLPNGTTNMLTISPGKFGTIDIAELGQLSLVPSNGQSAKARTITIYQVGAQGAHVLLGSVEVGLDGGVVQSPTSPSFGLELIRIQ